AGNGSELSDGGSGTLLMSMDRAKALGVKPKLIFRGFAVAGCEPDEMGIGPVYAIPKLLKRTGVKFEDIGVWELNEAFASQVIYCRDKLGIPMDKLNPNGGSISIGHPFGMTGSRMVGTIANEMLRRKAKYGVVTMCIGGGQGAAGLFEACLLTPGGPGVARESPSREARGLVLVRRPLRVGESARQLQERHQPVDLSAEPRADGEVEARYQMPAPRGRHRHAVGDQI